MGVGQSRNETALVLGQAIGPEFSYYQELLSLPEHNLLIRLGDRLTDTNIGTTADSIQTLTRLGVFPTIFHEDFTTSDAVGSDIASAFEARGIQAQTVNEGVFTYEDEAIEVNTAPIRESIDASTVPIVGSVTTDKLVLNGNRTSAKLASALNAAKFITLHEVGGVLDAQGSIIPVLNLRSGIVDQMIKNGTINQAMVPRIKEIVTYLDSSPDDAAAVIVSPASLIRELYTHAGEGTLIRKGDEIVRYDSLDAVNKRSIRRLIESSFGGKLPSRYFKDLPKNAEIFTTAQVYNGVAIVIPGLAPSDPAYMDKLVVRPGLQGMGIGKELIDAVISGCEGGLYWRTRSSNHKQVDWYSRIADNVMAREDWTVFTRGVKPEMQDTCLNRALIVQATVNY